MVIEMEDLQKQFATKEAFDTFFEANHKDVTFADLREGIEEFVKEAGLEILSEEYVKSGKVSKADYKDNLANTARFYFDNAMTEAYYEKNPEVYEAAFGLYELDQANSVSITKTFHERYRKNYESALDEMYDELIEPLVRS